MASAITVSKRDALVESLSRKGETAFAKENWQEAEKHFTAALHCCVSLVDQATRDSLGLSRINAKRSTCRLRLNKFMEALDDAHSASRAGEASGALREAEACAYLQAYERSSNAYNKAADMMESESPSKSARYRASAIVMQNLQSKITAVGPLEDSKEYPFRLDLKLHFEVNAGLAISRDFPKMFQILPHRSPLRSIERSSLEWLIFFWKLFEGGLQEFFADEKDLKSTAIINLTRAIIGDSLPDKIERLVKLQLVEIGLNVNALDSGSLLEELRSAPWKSEKGRIYNNNVSVFLSGAFILAFFEEKKGNYGEAALRYALITEVCDALKITELQMARPRDFDLRENFDLALGFALSRAFPLGTRARRLDCLVKGHQILFRDAEIIGGDIERMIPPFGLKLISDESILILSADCRQAEGRDMDHLELTTHAAHAFSHRHLAALEYNLVKSGVATYMNPELMEEAVGHYFGLLTDRLDIGDPDARLASILSLECSFYLGGLPVQLLLERFASSEQICDEDLSMLYGIPIKTSEAYLFVKKICDQLKGLLAMGTISPKTVLKPVPIIRRSDVPKKKNWKDMMEKDFYDNVLPAGDYSVVHWIE